MELHQRIAALRKERGLSQLELAEALNVSRRAISRWENGIVVPSTENIVTISEFFGVQVDSLIDGSIAIQPEKSASVVKNEVHAENAKGDYGWVGNQVTKGALYINLAAIAFLIIVTVWVIFAHSWKKERSPVQINQMQQESIDGVDQISDILYEPYEVTED